MICAVVLAAGRSTRMGAQKLLLPMGGKPVIRRIVDELLAAALDDIAIVVGADGSPIRNALDGCGVRFVTNHDPQSDMLGSIRCGLRALPESCTGVMVVLGDQPGITRELLSRLTSAFDRKGKGIVVPEHGDHRGHPVILAVRYREELLRKHDDTGLRGLLAAYPDDVERMAVNEDSLLADMDTLEDYARMKERL